MDSVLERLDFERRTLQRDGDVIEMLPLVTRNSRAEGTQHNIEFSCLAADNAEEAIRAEVAHYRALGVEVEWKVYSHDQPPDLRQRLARHGFEIDELETVVVLDLTQPPEWIAATLEHNVQRVRDERQLEQFRQVAKEIYRRDFEPLFSEMARAMSAGSTEHLGYIALDQGDPVSIGRLYTHHESWFGGLYGGGTLAPHRGRGFYRAVVAARAKEAIKLGARWLLVDAMPTSRPILERLGFARLTDTWRCVLKP